MSKTSDDMMVRAKTVCTRLGLRGGPLSLSICAEELMAAHQAAVELAIKRAIKAWPRAHTYASENADAYRAQDRVRDTIVKSLEDYLAHIRKVPA
jgi:hypothetical protein